METVKSQINPPRDVARRLERLHNRPTAWELLAVGPHNQRYLIAYTARPGKANIWRIITAHADQIIQATGAASLDWDAKQKTWTADTGWTIGLDRTQRDAITNGEYPTIEEAPMHK